MLSSPKYLRDVINNDGVSPYIIFVVYKGNDKIGYKCRNRNIGKECVLTYADEEELIQAIKEETITYK